MVTDVAVGSDRIMLTAYNPSSYLTMAKCLYVLTRIHDELGRIDEAEFEAWMLEQAGGAEVLEKLRRGPVLDLSPSVDPRNAREEVRIISHLRREAIEQCGQRRLR